MHLVKSGPYTGQLFFIFCGLSLHISTLGRGGSMGRAAVGVGAGYAGGEKVSESFVIACGSVGLEHKIFFHFFDISHSID